MLPGEYTRYRTFLNEEFAAAQFLQDDPFGLGSVLLQEVVATILSPDFEGTINNHGVIILSNEVKRYRDLLPQHTCEIDGRDEVRLVCEGMHVYRYVGPKESGIIVFPNPINDELDLFTLRDDALFKKADISHEEQLPHDMFLIKRFASGDITVFCREGIARHHASRWTFARYQYEYKRLLLERIENIGDWNKQITNSILRMVVQMLGPIHGVGTTIVLLHEDDRKKEGEKRLGTLMNRENAITFPWEMNITDRAHQRILADLVRRTDGATVVEPNGVVSSIRTWLTPPQRDMTKHRSGGGTRHLSGEVFSGHIEGLVFVVSASGPVSVYRKGRCTLRTSDVDPEARELGGLGRVRGNPVLTRGDDS